MACYGLVGLFALAGVGVLVWGAATGAGLVALAGSEASVLFWPALANARRIRETNVAIRLLEIPLSRAETADQAAHALREFFLALVAGRGKQE